MIRLLVSDLDGTLVPLPGASGANTSACRRFAERWRQLPARRRPVLGYSSGRLAPDLQQAARHAGLPRADYLLAGVGTAVLGPDRQPLAGYQARFEPGWDRARVDEIVASLPGVEAQPPRYQSPFKSSWYWHHAGPRQLDALRRRLAEAGLEVTLIYSSQRDLDLLPRAADKGEALRWLIGELGLVGEQVVVAGDTGNDASMFRVPGVRGILPANAREELRSVVGGAEVVFAEARGADGVLEGLEGFGLFWQPVA